MIYRVSDPPISSSGDTYPLIGASRIGSKNFGEDDPTAAEQREAISYCDIVLLGRWPGQQMDNPGAGWLDYGDVCKDIYDRAVAKGNDDIIIGQYFNGMEANVFDLVTYDPLPGVTAEKIQNEQGPIDAELEWAPYPSDWCARAANGVPVASGFGGQFVNLSDNVVQDSNGDRYGVWYTKSYAKDYFGTAVTAGVPEANLAYYLDNYRNFSRKSGIDWDGDGVNEDLQDYWNPYDPTHLTGVDAYGSLRSECVAIAGSWRAEYRRCMNEILNHYPDTNMWGNTNQWWNDYAGSLPSPENIMPEYQLGGDPTRTDIHLGFSEKNSHNDFEFGWPRSGVGADGTRKVPNTWQMSYNSAYFVKTALSGVGFVNYSWSINCTRRADVPSTPAGFAVWHPYPASGAVYHMHRWAMATSQICGTPYCCSGVQVGEVDAGETRSTVLFDEYGLVNQATTGLARKWLGAAIDPIPIAPLLAHSTGAFWGREFENGYVLVNTDNDETNAAATCPLSALPFSSGEMKRIDGAQDPTFNNGATITGDITLDPIDGIFLERI